MSLMSTVAAKAFSPITIGPLRLRNRFIKSGAYEGATTADGLPSKHLVAHHRAMAVGGIGMTTVAYTAVSALGRIFGNQLWARPEALKPFRVLTDTVHSEGAAVSLQLVHGGSYTFMRRPGELVGPSASTGLNEGGALTGSYFRRAMRESEIAAVATEFADAALFAREAGFDAVEIHMGHGYLLSQFLTPTSNRRHDQYGGTAEKRARFPALVTQKILDAVGDNLAVTCKINVVDGHRGGVEPADAAVTARVLEHAGAHMLVLSGGRNVEAPWAIFGSPFPISEMQKYASRFLERVAWSVVNFRTPREIKTRQFQEMYFLQASQVVRAATTVPLTFIGGVNSMKSIERAMLEKFDCIGMVRPLIHDPNILLKFQDGTETKSGCTSCNLCVAYLSGGLGAYCVFNERPDPISIQAAVDQ